jgi:hypothetical protein
VPGFAPESEKEAEEIKEDGLYRALGADLNNEIYRAYIEAGGSTTTKPTRITTATAAAAAAAAAVAAGATTKQQRSITYQYCPDIRARKTLSLPPRLMTFLLRSRVFEAL